MDDTILAAETLNEDHVIQVPVEEDTETLLEDSTPKKLRTPKSKGPCACLSLSYYQPYFDIDTKDILDRFYYVGTPWKEHSTKFMDLMNDHPDGYGPFWLAATLVFLFASCSNIASYLDYMMPSEQSENLPWTYDFTRVATAATMVTMYVVGLPLAFWGIGKYISMKLDFVLLFCIYGYSTLPYLFVACICIIPIDAMDWIALLLSMSWTLAFILKNLWPILSHDETKAQMFTVISAIAGVQLVWTVLVKVLFF